MVGVGIERRKGRKVWVRALRVGLNRSNRATKTENQEPKMALTGQRAMVVLKIHKSSFCSGELLLLLYSFSQNQKY